MERLFDFLSSSSFARFFVSFSEDDDARILNSAILFAFLLPLLLLRNTAAVVDDAGDGAALRKGFLVAEEAGLRRRLVRVLEQQLARGAPAVPQASPAKSELTPDESPQKNKQTRGTQHLDELLRKLGVEWDERPSSAPALRRH